MCGIVGILSLNGHGQVSSNVLARMRDTMTHRGPDGGSNDMRGHRGCYFRTHESAIRVGMTDFALSSRNRPEMASL